APLTDEEFEAFEPLDTRITTSHSSASSDSTALLSPDHPLTQASPTFIPTRVLFYYRNARMIVCTQPALSPGMSARIAKAATLSSSSFHKRHRPSYETSSSSPALPIRKRYREGEGYSSEGEGYSLEDKGLGTEEEVAPEGQQQAVLVVDNIADESLGLGYGALRRCELALGEGLVPNTFEVGQSSRSVPEHKGAERISAFRQPTRVTWFLACFTITPVVPSPIASLVTTLAATISIDEDQFFKELYTRSGAVRDEIFSQRYRFRSLEREKERATMIFSAIWRPMLALKAWVGQTNAQRAALWHVIYDIQRENHDLRRQIAEERRKRLELTDRVDRMERRHKSRGE
nr:hypothetical protein [Tanacetum cinerariifolium]GEX42192.1 hypothetical protein [Tanacetum cinerariifolium]